MPFSTTIKQDLADILGLGRSKSVEVTNTVPVAQETTERISGGRTESEILRDMQLEDENKKSSIAQDPPSVTLVDSTTPSARKMLAEEAFLEGSSMGKLESQKRAKQVQQQSSVRPGISLEREPETPAVDVGTRLKLSFLTDVQDQVTELNKLIQNDPNLGGERARYDENVGLILPKFDADTGRVVDVVVDPEGTEGDLGGDIADVIGTIFTEGAVAVSGLGAAKIATKLGSALRSIGLINKTSKVLPDRAVTRGVLGAAQYVDELASPLVSRTSQLGAMSSGTAGARQVLEYGARGFELPEGGFEETGRRFQQEAMVDFALNTAIGLGGAAMFPWASKYKNSPEVQTYTKMVNKLNKDLNLRGKDKIKPSLGEATGFENLIKLEQFSGKQLLVGPRLRSLQRQRERALLEVSNSILEKYGSKTSDEVLNYKLELEKMFADREAALGTGSLDTQQRLLTELQKDINRKYNQLAGPSRYLSLGEQGQQVRLGLQERLKVFRDQSDVDYKSITDSIKLAKQEYGDLIDFRFLVKLDNPAKTVRKLFKDARYWQTKSEKVRKRVPSKSGIGSEDVMVETEVVKEFTEYQLLSDKLKKYASIIDNVKKEGATLEYMESIRREISDDIATSGGWTGQIAPQEANILRGLRKDIDSAIEKGIESIPDSSISEKIKAARSNYTLNRDKYKIDVVQKLLNTTAEGKISNNSVLKEITRSNETYEGFKSLFDGQPDVWDSFKRPFLDSIAEASLVDEGKVGISRLIKQLDQAPESVKVDLLGADYRKAIKFLREAERVAPTMDKDMMSVDSGVINKFFTTGYSEESKVALKKSMNASRKIAAEASSQLNKKLNTPLSRELIEKGEFVSVLVDKATPTQAKNIIKRAGTGDIRDDFRRKVLEHFFTKTQTTPMLELAQQSTAKSYKSGIVGDVFRNELNAHKSAYRTYLGDEIMDILEAFTVVNEYGDAMLKRVGVDVGAFSAGSNINKLLTSPGETKLGDSLSGYTGYALVAFLLNNAPARAWLTAKPLTRTQIMRGMAATELLPDMGAEQSVLSAFAEVFDDPNVAAEATSSILSEALPDESSDVGAASTQDLSEPVQQ